MSNWGSGFITQIIYANGAVTPPPPLVQDKFLLLSGDDFLLLSGDNFDLLS